ncbi:hypothetical protein C8259_11900 [Nocardia nova]|uniref:NAD-dependent epimerase/dehydratase domain-containing protein n=1 Tax=Nocardia nova TaxID=37330 RepID=A0A2T2Z6K4_9NOCA|nr:MULTISPECIES: hypothetical protein [Nocardia]PSR63380.1 hypothetical protein C8259_11900 [Nocardia nova]
MRVAITGASGNVGTALLRALPDAEVVAIARRPSPTDREPYARARPRRAGPASTSSSLATA